FQGTINLGGQTLIGTSGDDIFIAKLDPNGKHLWSQAFTGMGAQDVTGMAVEADGGPVIVGSYTKAFTAGNTNFTLGATEARGGFALRFDPSGKLLWSNAFNSDSDSTWNAVAVAPNGDTVFGGNFSGTIGFCFFTCTKSAGGDDVLVERVDANGKFV